MTMKPFRRTPQYLNWQRIRASLFIGLSPALAMTSLSVQSEEGLQLEEVLVTATRRVSDLQTTPVAVTAIDGEKFDSMFADSIADVALLTPNFSAAQITGFNAAGFAMRGASQTDILVYWEPPVGVLVDDFVIPHMQTQLLDPYDIESIEVMRGPQGTLFGKNTTAGVVNVRTKRPVLNDFGLDASAMAGDYGRQEFKVNVNVPIIDDTLAFRIAAMSRESDGYYENGKDSIGSAGGNYIGDGRDLGGDDSISGRAKLLWTPTDKLSILFQYEYLDDQGDSAPAVNTTDPNSAQLFNVFGLPGVTKGDPLDQAGVTNRDRLADGTPTGLRFGDGHNIDIDGYYLNMDWEVGKYTVNSITGYRDQDSYLPSTYTGEVGDENAVVSIFDAVRYDTRETFQQEIRVASNYDGPFNFVAGGFYQEDQTDFNVVQYLGLLDIFGTSVPGVLDDDNPRIIGNNQDMESVAVFFDGTYEFADTWTASAGARWTSEQKEFFSRPATPIVLYGESPGTLPIDVNNTGKYPCDTTNPLDCQSDNETWDEMTYRALISNQFTDDLYGYASFSHGFKSGGYSDQAGSGIPVSIKQTRYDPEEADSYEIGLKFDTWDGRARLNTAAFYVEYSDMQRATIVTTVEGLQETVVFNAAEVTAWGLEFEGTLLILEGLTVNANVGYLDTEYDEFGLDLDLLDPSTPEVSLDGEDVTRAPEWTAGIDVTWQFDVGNWGDITAIVGAYYEDESVFYYAIDLPSEGNPGGTPVPEFNTYLEDHTLINASVKYTHSSGKWYLAAFGKNLDDERYKNSSQYVGGLWTFSTYAEPRVYGVELGISLGDL
jgi:iron complex outermembrane receptor protein